MLWTMLVLMSSACFLCGCIDAVRHSPSSLTGWAVAMFFGVALGAVNFWMLHKAAEFVDRWLRTYSSHTKTLVLRGVYLATLLWIPIAGLLGNVVTSRFIK